MTPSHTIQSLQAEGFGFFLARDSLKFSGPRDLTADERDALQQHKAEIVNPTMQLSCNL